MEAITHSNLKLQFCLSGNVINTWVNIYMLENYDMQVHLHVTWPVAPFTNMD